MSETKIPQSDDFPVVPGLGPGGQPGRTKKETGWWVQAAWAAGVVVVGCLAIVSMMFLYGGNIHRGQPDESQVVNIRTTTRIPAATNVVMAPPTAVPDGMGTPQCDVDVTGRWQGSGNDDGEILPYAMDLVQTGCQVTGTSLSEDVYTATVSGYVEGSIFYFFESGPDTDMCYEAGWLLIEGNQMTGWDENCSGRALELSR